MSRMADNTPLARAFVTGSGSLLGRTYNARITAFKSVFGAWKNSRVDHVKALACLRRERDRKLPALKHSR